MPTDLELLSAWRAGDEAAGNTLVRRHFSKLLRFFRGKVDEGIDDLLQRCFLAAVEGKEKILEAAGFRAYLFGIARRQLLLYYREKRRDGRSDPLHSGLMQQSGRSPSVHVRLQEEQDLLLRALRQVPIDFQIALELYYWEGMQTAEIAAVLEIAPGTVKSRLARGRDMVRKHITEADVPDALRSSTITNLESWARSLRDSLGEEPK